NSGETIPSISDFYLHALWFEKEQEEKLRLGIQLKTGPLLFPCGDSQETVTTLPKLPMNPNKSEAPYPEESYEWKNFSILDGETHGNFEWLVCFDPEKVVESRVKIGFHHVGLEKIMSEQNLLQLVPFV